LQRFIDDPGLVTRLASNAPPIKTIAEDAREWEERYTAVSAATNRPVAGTG
jgi:hypothetical protein